MDMLPMLALRNALDGKIPGGTAFRVLWVTDAVLEDDPVYQSVRTRLKYAVSEAAHCLPEHVTVVEFGPAVLAATLERYRNDLDPMFPSLPPWLAGATAVVGYKPPADPVCSLCGSDLALATGICVRCGYDELGYYDEDDDDLEYSPLELADARERIAEAMAGVRWPVDAPLSEAGREALG